MPRKRTAKTATPAADLPAPTPISDEHQDEGQDDPTTGASEVEVEVETSTPPKNRVRRLADRLKAAVLGGEEEGEAEDKPAARASLSKRHQEFAAQMCVLMAIILCWCLEGVMAPAYKPVAPTQKEGEAITAPIARIIARRLKKAGKMSEDTMDVLLIMAGITFYVDRARQTAQEITQQLLEEQSRGNGQTAFAVDSAGQLAPVAAGQAQPARTRLRGTDARQTGRVADGGNGRAVDPMDALLAADAIGRFERGLT